MWKCYLLKSLALVLWGTSLLVMWSTSIFNKFVFACSFYVGLILNYYFCSVSKLCPTLCNLMDCSMPGSSVLHYLQKFAQLYVHWVGDAIYLILFHPLLLPSVFFSISVFSNELALLKCPKYWSFNFSTSPSNEYSWMISFGINWFDLLSAQGTLKSLLHHHSSKASILQHSTFFMLQLSHLYMTTGKTIALTIWAFVGKVMSLLFNMLSKFVIAFLPRSISLNFMAAVIIHSEFGAQEIKICHCFHFSLSICMKWCDWIS